MQPSFNSAAARAGAAVSLGWQAMGAGTGSTRRAGEPDPSLDAAGVRWREGPEGEGGQLEMHLSPDMQALLDIRPGRERRQDAPPSSQPGQPLRAAIELLDLRMVDVFHWLSTPGMRQQLAAQRLTREQVVEQVHYNSEAVMARLEDGAERGVVNLVDKVPTAHELFTSAVLDAYAAELVADPAPANPTSASTPASTPATTSATTATTATTSATTQATVAASSSSTVSTTGVTTAPTASVGPAATIKGNPWIDLARRQKSLDHISQFQARYYRVLPQIAHRRLSGLWDFVQGDIEFADAAHVAAVFPCALQLKRDQPDGRWRGTYPMGGIERPRLREPFLRNTPVAVARAEDAPVVRICTDGSKWRNTPFYTDDTVEAAKVAMWENVLRAGDLVYRKVLERSLWRR